jgi:hypothetical protein
MTPTLENQIANQIFKISKADKDIRDYLIDCGCVTIKIENYENTTNKRNCY